MPAPQTWDTPGLTYDSGVTWDSLLANKPRPMNSTKAIIDFSGFTANELGPVAHVIHDQMTANAATFTTPPLTMAAFQTQVDDYDTKFQARANNAKTDIVAFNEARAALEDTLSGLGNYVNSIAKGDPAIVVLSGFPSYTTSRTADTSAPGAPADLRLRQGDQSGGIVARYKPDRQGSTNEVQACTADPNVEANWSTKGLFQGGRAELGGFTPGTVVWIRVRTVGLRGVMGLWSDPAQIRVL